MKSTPSRAAVCAIAVAASSPRTMYAVTLRAFAETRRLGEQLAHDVGLVDLGIVDRRRARCESRRSSGTAE